MTGVSGDMYDIASTFTNLVHLVFRKDPEKFEIYPLKTELWKKIKVKEGFQGSGEELMRVDSLAGGYAFSGANSSLAYANESSLINPRITTKRFYAVSKVDTKSMAEAMNDKGAFEGLLKRVRRDMERKIQNGMSLCLFHSNISNELVLGTIASGGVSGSAGSGWTLTLDTFKKELFHKKQILHIEDGNTDPFEVTAVTDSSITVSRLSGSQVPAATDEIFLEGGDGNAFTGLKAITASSGTLYNVSIGGQWEATIKDKSGRPLNTDMLFNLCVDVENHCGKKPDLLICSKEQFQKLGEYIEARYLPCDAKKKDTVGHDKFMLQIPGLQLEVIWDRHCDADRVYLLNSECMEFYKSPMSGLVKDNGSLLMPDYINGTDSYLMVYRLYGEFFIEPCYVGLLDNLDTTVE